MADTLVIHDGAGGAGGAERTVVEAANALDADLYLGYCNIPREWFDKRVDNTVTVAGVGDKLPSVRDVLVALHFATTTFPEYDTIVTSGPPAKFCQPHDRQEHYHYLHHPALGDVLWYEGALTSYVAGALDRFEARGVPHLIANSKLTARRTHAQYNRTVDAIINPPVDVERFKHTDNHVRGRFVMIGRLVERKRPDVAIEAFARLDGDAKLVVLGDGPMLDNLQQIAPENVELRGYVDDEEAARILGESGGAVTLPRTEDFGITAVEYLAAGTPVVAVDEPNTNNIVSDDTGVLVEPRPAAVEAGVLSVMNEDWDRDSIAATAEQYSSERFHEEVQKLVSGSTCEWG